MILKWVVLRNSAAAEPCFSGCSWLWHPESIWCPGFFNSYRSTSDLS